MYGSRSGCGDSFCQDSIGQGGEPSAHGDEGFAAEAQDHFAFGADESGDGFRGDLFGGHAADTFAWRVRIGIDEGVEEFRAGGAGADHEDFDVQRSEFDAEGFGPSS